MAQKEYYEFGQDKYISVDAEDKVSVAGLVVNVKGEVDVFLGSTSGIGAISDMYKVCLDPGQIILLDLQKTTTMNNSKLKIGTFAYNYNLDDEENAEKATDIKNGNGLTTITAADGKTYSLLVNNSDDYQEFYVSVAMERRTFDFGVSDINDVIDLAKDISDVYDDDMENRLNLILEKNIDSDKDVLGILKEEFYDIKDIIADAEDILGTNPLLTYQLDLIDFVDEEAPVMSNTINCELYGNDLKLTWEDANDNFFVSNYDVKIYNSSNQLVKQHTTPIKTFFVNDLAKGQYTTVISARDYSGNLSEEVATTITVDGNAPGFKRGTNGTLSAKTETVIDTFTITDSTIYRWQDINFFPAVNGTLTLYLYDGKGKKVSAATATYKNGVLSVKKDFVLSNGTYTLKATSTVAGDFTAALSKLEIAATANNSLTEATTITLDSSSSTNIGGYVGSGDADDFYKIALPGAGLLTFNPEVMDNKMILSVYNKAGKKLKSVTAVANKLNGISNLLVVEDAAYLSVSSADKGKGGYNNNYSAAISFFKFKDSEYDTIENPNAALGLGASTVDNWIGYGDQYDYYNLNLTSPGYYTLDTVSQLGVSCKITIYVKDAKGKYKKLKYASGKLPKIDILLDPKDKYILEIQVPKASKGEQTDYTIRINGKEFTNANKYKDSLADVMGNTSDAPTAYLETGNCANLIQDEWVGYGDEWDYRSLDIECSGQYTFDFKTDGASEFGIYQSVTNKKGVVSLKKLKSVKSSKKVQTTVQLKNLFLTAGTYYIGVRSTQANKSAGAYYSIDTNSKSEFFIKCDNGLNNIYSTTADELSLHQDGYGWVGFADATDVFKVTTEGSGVYEFTIENVSNNVRLTVFEITAGKEKKLSTLNVKSGAVGASSVSLGSGQYYVRVEATGAKSGKNSDYDVTMQKLAAFDNSNDTLNTATKAEAGEMWEGAVVNKIDRFDWYDVSEVNEIDLDVSSGSLKAVFYGADGKKVKVANIENAQGDLLKPTNSFSMKASNIKSDNICISDIDESFCYLAIEGSSKPAAYAISFY